MSIFKKRKTQQTNTDLVPSLRDSLFNNSIKDLSVDITEIGVDVAINEGILSEVPIVKTVVAIGKTGLAIRERNLMKQTIAFINGVNEGDISEEQKNKYREKFTNNPKHASSELERVLILLDSNVDMFKSKMLGRLYGAYIKGAVSWDVFCEYSEVNRRMFVEDYKLLIKLATNNLSLSNQERYKMGRLISLGLVVEKDSPAATKSPLEEVQRCLMVKDAKTDPMRNIFKRDDYEVTSLGQGFVHLVHDRRELKGRE